MELYEALYTTRAMRRLAPDPIPYDIQARILDAAIRAPSAGNEQHWQFVLIDDPALKEALARLYLEGWEKLLVSGYANPIAPDPAVARVSRSADHLARHFAEVPLFLIGCVRSEMGSSIYPALWSAMLAARAEGIGATLATIHTYFSTQEVLELLGAPRDGGWHLHGIVALGYPLGKWGVARREPAHTVASRNGWAGKLGFEVPEPLWPRV